MAYEAKKRAGSDGERPNKRTKAVETDPSTNPYLAHMYDGSEQNANGVGMGKRGGANGGYSDSILNTFVRHNTTAEQCMKAEDGPTNPFNGKPLSKKYFGILETRRNLPVHQQR